MLLMAIMNRRSGMAKGGTKPFQSVVAASWKGVQSLRNFAASIARTTNVAQTVIRFKMSEFSTRFRSFDTQTRQGWDSYAGSLGSAVDREMNDNVSYAKNIIPHRRKLMSGINVYVARNIEGYLAGMATPLDIAPVGRGTPYPPLNVDASYGNGKLRLGWIDPVFSVKPNAAFVRIWIRLANHHSKLLVHIALPSSGSVEFTHIRPGRLLALIPDDVLVRVQLDTITQGSIGEAPIISAGSNVAEAVIVNDWKI